MHTSSQHTFQIITKRSERLAELASQLKWTPNIWMGVTVEHFDYQYRIKSLTSTNAKIKFLCLEPLLSAMPDLDLTNINWVILGGESGPEARPIKKAWVTEIRDICLKSNTPFFFKQWGGFNKNKNGRLLDGKIWEETPAFFNQSQISLQLEPSVCGLT